MDVEYDIFCLHIVYTYEGGMYDEYQYLILLGTLSLVGLPLDKLSLDQLQDVSSVVW